MSAPRTRRAALRAGAAALGALCVPAVALTLPEPAADPDAELFALLDRWRHLVDGMAGVVSAFDAAGDRAVAARPPLPAELWWTVSDQCMALGADATGRGTAPNGRPGFFYYPWEVDKLRAAGPVKRWADTVEGDQVRREPDSEGEARRRAIIGAHDRWAAACRTVEDRVGYTAAHEAIEAQAAEINAAEDAVMAREARTRAGLGLKARWAADLLADDGGPDGLAEKFIREVARFGGVTA